MQKLNRYERKWIYKSNDPLPLINSLIRSNFFFKYDFPKRKVNSIYFDTQDYSSIRQNLDGISNKKKIRLRWYGERNRIIDPILEIKSKKGFETKKESFMINDLNNICFKDLNLISKCINLNINPKKPIYPILTTNYEREYFISSNNKIRATVDYNLKSIFLKNLSQIEIIKNFKSVCILEFKYPKKSDQFVRRNLKDMSLRLSKNSKFVNSAFEIPRSFS